jgi:branched-chain amino acid transport system substrate-binding protein
VKETHENHATNEKKAHHSIQEKMNMKAMKFVVILVVLSVLFTACSPTPTATPTEAPVAATAAATEAPVVAGAPDVCSTDTFGCAVFKPGEVLKIGMGAPMTGGDASYGIDISQGGTIAVQDFGEVEGFKFVLVAEDDGGTAEGGAAVANKFASDPAVVAVAGHIYSGATSSAMPIYEKVGIPMLSPSASLPALTTMGSSVFNRIVFTDARQGPPAAEYLFNKLAVKKLAVLHDGSDYGKGLAEAVAAKFTELGGEVVATEAITKGETDYTPVLSAVSSKTPDAVYFGGYTAEGAVIVNQMKQTGLENAIFFGDDGTYGADFLARTGANGENAFATIAPIPADSAEKAAFDAAYLAQFGKEAGSLSPYTWNGYDATAGLISAVKSVAVLGTDGNLYVPRGALVTAVRTLKDYKGIGGTYSCDATGECNTLAPMFVVIKGGAWVPAP